MESWSLSLRKQLDARGLSVDKITSASTSGSIGHGLTALEVNYSLNYLLIQKVNQKTELKCSMVEFSNN